jgi:predicted transposase/invertase (TIGR01784 family)
MPDYHDIFWKLLFQRMDCAIEFFRFLLKEKADLLELENLIFIQEIYYRKKKLLYDILFEVPIRNSDEKLYFLLEHKSRRANDFTVQMMKYKQVIHKWQKKEFGRMYSIIPVLFYQGLENWDPENDLREIKALNNPILSGQREEFLIFNLQKIDPVKDFVNPELRAGLLLLKIIRFPWEEFVKGWHKIKEILNSMEEAKKIDLEEEMLDYIFRSRSESRDLVEEIIMGKQRTLTLYERALEEGELKKAIETARKMLEKGFSVSEIQDITGLSDNQLKENGVL